MRGWEVISALLVGASPRSRAGEKVFIDSAPDVPDDGENPYPFVVGHRVAVKRDYGLDNTLLEHKETYMLECWGETRNESNELADEVAATLEVGGFPPDDNGPDGLDPVVDVRCTVLYVSCWLETPYEAEN